MKRIRDQIFNSGRNTPRIEIEPLNLSRARCGERLRIVSIDADSPAGQRLRELGFQEMAEVRKVAENGALICNLLGARIALSRELGSLIMVERISL